MTEMLVTLVGMTKAGVVNVGMAQASAIEADGANTGVPDSATRC